MKDILKAVPQGMHHKYKVVQTWPGGPKLDSMFRFVHKLGVYMNDNLPLSPKQILDSPTFFIVEEEYSVKAHNGQPIYISENFYVVENYRLSSNAGGYVFRVGKATVEARPNQRFFKTLAEAVKYLVYFAPVLAVADTNTPDLSIELRYFPMNILQVIAQRVGIPSDLVRQVLHEELQQKKD